jgi:hypothetical protein
MSHIYLRCIGMLHDLSSTCVKLLSGAFLFGLARAHSTHLIRCIDMLHACMHGLARMYIRHTSLRCVRCCMVCIACMTPTQSRDCSGHLHAYCTYIHHIPAHPCTESKRAMQEAEAFNKNALADARSRELVAISHCDEIRHETMRQRHQQVRAWHGQQG